MTSYVTSHRQWSTGLQLLADAQHVICMPKVPRHSLTSVPNGHTACRSSVGRRGAASSAHQCLTASSHKHSLPLTSLALLPLQAPPETPPAAPGDPAATSQPLPSLGVGFPVARGPGRGLRWAVAHAAPRAAAPASPSPCAPAPSPPVLWLLRRRPTTRQKVRRIIVLGCTTFCAVWRCLLAHARWRWRWCHCLTP